MCSEYAALRILKHGGVGVGVVAIFIPWFPNLENGGRCPISPYTGSVNLGTHLPFVHV